MSRRVAALMATAGMTVVMLAFAGVALAHANHDPLAGWFQRCALAKTGTFDPIVFPNDPGPVGHEHLFFGATAISHDSTVSSLRAGAPPAASRMAPPAATTAATGYPTCCCATAKRGPAASS